MKKQEPPLKSSGMDIPDYAIMRLARYMLPLVQAYYDSNEGKQELRRWKAEKPDAASTRK